MRAPLSETILLWISSQETRKHISCRYAAGGACGVRRAVRQLRVGGETHPSSMRPCGKIAPYRSRKQRPETRFNRFHWWTVRDGEQALAGWQHTKLARLVFLTSIAALKDATALSIPPNRASALPRPRCAPTNPGLMDKSPRKSSTALR